MIGSHGRPELSGTVKGDPIGERMEDFERLYAYKWMHILLHRVLLE